MHGQLVPAGGGDPIPLLKKSLTVGRRENCDIVLRFGNVSGNHCQLSVDQGYWFVQDLNSQNGVKVNGVRVSRKRLDPGCELIIAKHKYEVVYNPVELGAAGPPPADDEALVNILSRSLMESAGLSRRAVAAPPPGSNQYNADNESARQRKKNNLDVEE